MLINLAVRLRAPRPRRWLALLVVSLLWHTPLESAALPHIVLAMTDDQGWGETSYNDHPILKTPHLDAMATAGLRLDRFYAAAPVCSPTRASVLTGRTNDRCGVISHGYALRRQEITISQILRDQGYVTGHFGKWHLNGLRGPGVPILAEDRFHPGRFGFDDWLSASNYFDRDPILSRRGAFKEFEDDSSEIIVTEALQFIRKHHADAPTFTVIWFGSPHRPFQAAPSDTADFQALATKSRHHYGELVAMDRSIGTLLAGLRDVGIVDDTLVWFCSDNGGLPGIQGGTVGSLRGRKGQLYEGGLRVPAIIHWPVGIKTPRVTEFPASTNDILPTLLAITSASHPEPNRPRDGLSLVPLFSGEKVTRATPLGFRYQGAAAVVHNEWKLIQPDPARDEFELYNLVEDPGESTNLVTQEPQVRGRLVAALRDWSESVDRSARGDDYPSGKIDQDHPSPRFWNEVDGYQPYLQPWRQRWEYSAWLRRRAR